MKYLLLLFSMNCFAISLEDARIMYNLNKQVMSEKEILLNYKTCQFQNELALILSEKQLHCQKRHESKDDTSKGNKSLSKQIISINKINDIYNLEIESNVDRMKRDWL